MATGTANTANAGQLAGTPNAEDPKVKQPGSLESLVAAQNAKNKNTTPEIAPQNAVGTDQTPSADGSTAEGRDLTRTIQTDALVQTPSNNENARTFYHRFAGSCTHLKDGTTIVFAPALDAAGNRIGKFTTDDPEAIEHLSKIADKPGTQVFTVKAIPEDAAAKSLAQQAAETKGNANEAGRVV